MKGAQSAAQITAYCEAFENGSTTLVSPLKWDFSAVGDIGVKSKLNANTLNIYREYIYCKKLFVCGGEYEKLASKRRDMAKAATTESNQTLQDFCKSLN